ncbi:diphthine methyl ester synthase [Nematocida sp. LUAm3]|nr:diphthine methyl ester synthase [Nematocida sp. LUAm3]KAI5174066.1 diphthine methyl ester synthase [Nematocida sp. LUAm2]KAI5177191.1 diphthine methyl ester synthase [Nematocida sp. LUAm1]
MLSLVGVGLEVEDLSIKALRILEQSDKVYLEKYTSILLDEEKIKEVIKKEIHLAYREDLEEALGEPKILEEAKTISVALLVVGTPLFATTHTELVLRAKELNIPVTILHNASIQNVMGSCGFNSYGFGRTVSIPFFLKEWRPYDFYSNILSNYHSGLHTLCLLDIKINEPTIESLMGKEDKRYTKYMRIPDALAQIKEASEHFNSSLLLNIPVVGIERFGQSTEHFRYGAIDTLLQQKYGPPLHSLIIPSCSGNTMERQCVERYFREIEQKK